MRWLPLLVGVAITAGCGAANESDDPLASTTTTSSPLVSVTTTSRSTIPPLTSSTTSTTATSTPTTSNAAVATTTTSVPVRLELRADGLGDLDFGEPTDQVMERLESLFGSPDPGEEYPYRGHPLRFVYWEDERLAVVFSDYEFYRDDGAEHLAGWSHSSYIGNQDGLDSGVASLTMAMAEEIVIGSTLADLQSAFGDNVVLEAECDPGGPPISAYMKPTDWDDGRVSLSIRVGFEDLPLRSTSRIASFTAGAGPGC